MELPALLIPICPIQWYAVTYLIKEPCRDSPLSGQAWVEQLLQGNPRRFRQNLRMDRNSYIYIRDLLLTKGLLEDSRHISVDEKLFIFLYIIGQRATNRNAQERFQRSGQTINKYNWVSNALIC